MPLICSIMALPSVVWVFITSNSSLVKRPGLSKILSLIAILPTSWRALAATITLICLVVRPYSGYSAAIFSAKIRVKPFTRWICLPLSRLRYSTTVPKSSMMRSLVRLRQAACSASFTFCAWISLVWSLTSFSKLFWIVYSLMILYTRRLTASLSKGLRIKSITFNSKHSRSVSGSASALITITGTTSISPLPLTYSKTLKPSILGIFKSRSIREKPLPSSPSASTASRPLVASTVS